MDVEQSVFNEGDGEEKTDQERIKACEKEDGPAHAEKIIREVDDRSDKSHGDDSEDEVFDLKLLLGNSRRAKGLDQIPDAPIDADA